MNLMWRAHRAVDRATRLPGLEAILRRRYDRLFESNVDRNLFRGVFPTFEAAQQAAPASRPVGYDNPSSAAMYADRTRRIHSHDYPTLFWLGKLLAEGCTRVFDLGGHIGLSYYAYRDYLDYPAGLRWLVHDVPAVVENGRRIAAEQGAGALSFDERFESAEGQEVLFSAGALQYLPQTLAERLAQLASPPRHLVLNLLPLHDRLSYFTSARPSVPTGSRPSRRSSRRMPRSGTAWSTGGAIPSGTATSPSTRTTAWMGTMASISAATPDRPGRAPPSPARAPAASLTTRDAQ